MEEPPTEAASKAFSFAAGDSSQDEAEEDVKQITVSSGPERECSLGGSRASFVAQLPGSSKGWEGLHRTWALG